jgi:hypothetical protein
VARMSGGQHASVNPVNRGQVAGLLCAGAVAGQKFLNSYPGVCSSFLPCCEPGCVGQVRACFSAGVSVASHDRRTLCPPQLALNISQSLLGGSSIALLPLQVQTFLTAETSNEEPPSTALIWKVPAAHLHPSSRWTQEHGPTTT